MEKEEKEERKTKTDNCHLPRLVTSTGFDSLFFAVSRGSSTTTTSADKYIRTGLVILLKRHAYFTKRLRFQAWILARYQELTRAKQRDRARFPEIRRQARCL